MTVEVGVVRGNFERVQTELTDLLVQLRVKTNNPDKLIALETQLEAINMRAETFLKSLGMIDDELNESDMVDESASMPSAPNLSIDESLVKEERLATESNQALTKSEDSIAENLKSEKIIMPSNSRSQGKESDVQVQLALEKNTDAINQLTTLVNSQGELLANMLTTLNDLQSTDSDNIEYINASIDEYLQTASKNIIQADLEHADQALLYIARTSSEELLKQLGILMETLGEQVMQPSVILYQFLNKILQSNLSDDQTNVIKRLLDYQRNMIQSVRKTDPLPSPWNRGMKDLF